MGPIKTHGLTNTLFVTHPEKRSIECGIHHTPETRQVKMAYNVPHQHQFIPAQTWIWAGINKEKSTKKREKYKLLLITGLENIRQIFSEIQYSFRSSLRGIYLKNN